ncbi:hypothetical protein Micbo1qcDRAFT_180659 [Microdochium bolleyi]|uniref:Uncharacterized protein n=1 Tax=Microdochium bolleyi TaxID=196109 RepID=A0A136IKW7_9PEZI|nr:hypothetical protein Micbo1qcDRAFT_180659 [Microdochium bolleyi]
MSQNDPIVIDDLSDLETDNHWISHRNCSTRTMSSSSDSAKWHFYTASATTTDSPPETSIRRTILSTPGNPPLSPLGPFESHRISSSPGRASEPRETRLRPSVLNPDGSHITADIIYFDDEDNWSDTENSAASYAWHKKLQEIAEERTFAMRKSGRRSSDLYCGEPASAAAFLRHAEHEFQLNYFDNGREPRKATSSAVSSRVISKKKNPERKSSSQRTTTRRNPKIQAGLKAPKKWELVDAILNVPDEGGRFVLTFSLPSASYATSIPQNERVTAASRSGKTYPVKRLMGKCVSH